MACGELQFFSGKFSAALRAQVGQAQTKSSTQTPIPSSSPNAGPIGSPNLIPSPSRNPVPVPVPVPNPVPIPVPVPNPIPVPSLGTGATSQIPEEAHSSGTFLANLLTAFGLAIAL